CQASHRVCAVVAGGAGLSYVQPLLLFFLAVATWGLAAKRRKLTAAGLIGIFLVAWPPGACMTVLPLQAWYSPHPPAAAGAEAMVVLSGAVLSADSPELQASLKENTYRRCRYGLWLWRRNPRLPVLLCGGSMPGLDMTAAAIMQQMMADEGVPD